MRNLAFCASVGFFFFANSAMSATKMNTLCRSQAVKSLGLAFFLEFFVKIHPSETISQAILR